MDLLTGLTRQLQARPPRIAFPEGSDSRILQAARRLLDDGIARIILLGDHDEILLRSGSTGISLDGMEVIEPDAGPALTDYIHRYREKRPRATGAVAARQIRKPLHYGAMMVSSGDADLLMAGVSCPTRRVIEAARACIGHAGDVTVISGFFLMTFSHRPPLLFADCAINVDPSPAELADIAISTGRNARHILREPARVALLSFSTRGSASHARVDKVRQALEIAREKAPDLLMDGELQADAALVATIAAEKLTETGPVAGAANVLIFPDLDAANIGYKLVRHLGQARAFGPVLQGFSRPVADLSRGASVDEIVSTAIVSLTAAGPDTGQD